MDKKRRKLSPGTVIAELEQVKEERAPSELESKSDKYKEQCTELQSENEKLQSKNEKLQSENEKLQSENEKLQSENEKLQSENEKLQKYLQDLESAKINVEEKSPLNLGHSDLTSLIAKIMNSRCPQMPGMVPPLSIPRHYLYGPTPMLTFNPLFPSGVGFGPNMSATPYPSTAFTYGKRCNSSSSSSSYLLAPNNSYPAFSSPYPASSNTHYPTSSNSPHPAPTSAYPCSSNRHYPATNSSYSGPSAMNLLNQPPGASPYPLMGPRGYDSKFGPSVNETNDDALNINSLPNEIILEVFSYLTQNQLGQIARVCRRWNVLTKSPVLWRKVDVEIFSSVWETKTAVKCFINGLPSCVTFIRLKFGHVLDFEGLCVKLHQNCPNLKELTLTHCGITYVLPELINFCTQFLLCVKKLVFRKCAFSANFRTVELNDNSKMEVLDLYSCHFLHFSKTQFSKMLYLKELRLENTPVNDACFEDTSFFNQLHVLHVGYTWITDRTFQAILRHGHNLKELYLCGVHLKAHDFIFSRSVFPQLKSICLGHHDLACEVVVSLIRSCPSLETIFVDEHVAESFATHPFVVANRCKSGIVKAIDRDHSHDVDYS